VPDDEARRAAAREEMLERAHGRGADGDFEGMAAELREALEEMPGDPFLLCWLGVAERELGLDGIAYERFRQALEADPQDPFILATAGNALAGFDDPDAEGALRAAALLGKDVALARWMYGAFLTREGVLDEGRRELEAARDLDPEDPVIRYELGVNLLLAGQSEAGIDSLFTAAEFRPEDGWTRVVLGLALLEDERLEEAGRELEMGARLEEHDAEAQFLAALALAALGDRDTAWEMLERGRFHAQGTDALLAQAVEERIEIGHGAARRFLREQVGPSAYRERLGARP
jgi:Flp pilus assembly protein TadD